MFVSYIQFVKWAFHRDETPSSVHFSYFFLIIGIMARIIVWDMLRMTSAGDRDRSDPGYYEIATYYPNNPIMLPGVTYRSIESVITENLFLPSFDEMDVNTDFGWDSLLFGVERRIKEDILRLMELEERDEMSLEEECKSLRKKRERGKRLNGMLLEQWIKASQTSQTSKEDEKMERMERIGRRDQKWEMSKKKEVESRLDKKTMMKRVKGGSMNKRVIQPCG